jgi:hypothetical protein
MMVRMHKNTFAGLFIALLLILGVTLPACTCGAPPAEKPAEKPVEKPVAEGLSFEAAEYVNDTYGFSVKYPNGWTAKPPAPGPTVVFGASSPAKVPAIIVDVVDGATFRDALTGTITGAGGSAIKVFSETATALSDGTPATEAEGAFSIKDVPIPLDAFWLGVKKGDKWVIVSVVTVGVVAEYNKTLFSEIAHTLQFK